MGIISLITGRKYEVGNNTVGFIEFDLIISENHNLSNVVTEHPVEDGSVFADHIKNNPESGSLSVMISNFSLSSLTSITNRVQDAFDELNRLWKSRELVTIVSVLKVYEDIAVTDISTDRSADTGDAIVFDISFQQLEKIKLKTVDVDVTVKVKGTKTNPDRQASAQSDQGRTTPKEVAL